MIAYFGGGEIPTYRELMHERGVIHMAMNYVNHRRRVKDPEWSIDEHFPAGSKILVDSGARAYNRPGVEVPLDEIKGVYNDYKTFIATNIDRIDAFYEFDATVMTPALREGHRRTLRPDKGIVVWHAEDGVGELHRLAREHARVAVSVTSLDDQPLAPVYRELARMTRLHFIGGDRTVMGVGVAWDSAAQSTWLSAAQRGETFVWAGHDLRRYDAPQKENARRRHRGLFESLALDVDKIMADDAVENLKLALWSWGQYYAFLHQGFTEPVTVTLGELNPENAENPSGTVAETRLEAAHQSVTVPYQEGTLELAAQAEAAFLQAIGDEENTGYKLTKKQRDALYDDVIKMHGSRLYRAFLREQREGGYLNKDVSGEIDRMRKLLESRDQLENVGFSLIVKAQQRGDPQVGLLTRLFGNPEAEPLLAPDDSPTAGRMLTARQIPYDPPFQDAEVVGECDEAVTR